MKKVKKIEFVYIPILKVMSVMEMVIGQQAELYANSRNEARVTRSERRSTDFAREEKVSRRKERRLLL
ncbi:hypothetical protein ALC57_18799 [Trachymyrmex cornetzi]|uniref:Uncharacterized protein n=1 Tax=Trachymyrmex cornetzi TaxID=471704 RepID=A0A151IQZ1_9HYME|nr:hypothetical protein ALC57_18799 [Trachymyrmex cornetzi]